MPGDQRLVDRIHKRWHAIAGDERFPRRLELAPDSFALDWANCLVIDLDPTVLRSRLVFVGETLRNAKWSAYERQPLSDYAETSLVRLAAAKIASVLAKRNPVSFGGTAILDDQPILYRAILLPLSERGLDIDHMLGAINFRKMGADTNVPDAKPAPNPIRAPPVRAPVVAAPPIRTPMRVNFR